MSILSRIQPFLMQVSQTPKVDLSGNNVNPGSVTADERMCVFEASGMLLGVEDVPEEDQKQVTVLMLMPLKSQVWIMWNLAGKVRTVLLGLERHQLMEGASELKVKD